MPHSLLSSLAEHEPALLEACMKGLSLDDLIALASSSRAIGLAARAVGQRLLAEEVAAAPWGAAWRCSHGNVFGKIKMLRLFKESPSLEEGSKLFEKLDLVYTQQENPHWAFRLATDLLNPVNGYDVPHGLLHNELAALLMYVSSARYGSAFACDSNHALRVSSSLSDWRKTTTAKAYSSHCTYDISPGLCLPYVKSMLQALHKLPLVSGTYWRGVVADLREYGYATGRVVEWRSFSSVSPLREDAEGYARGASTPNGWKAIANGQYATLCQIEVRTGRDITFVHEQLSNWDEEVLLLPGTKLEVVSIFPFVNISRNDFTPNTPTVFMHLREVA